MNITQSAVRFVQWCQHATFKMAEEIAIESTNLINIIVKTAKDKETISVEATATIKEVIINTMWFFKE